MLASPVVRVEFYQMFIGNRDIKFGVVTQPSLWPLFKIQTKFFYLWIFDQNLTCKTYIQEIINGKPLYEI